MHPKLKDVHKIADAMASQVMTPPSTDSSSSNENSSKSHKSSRTMSRQRSKSKQKRARSRRDTVSSSKPSSKYHRAYSLRSVSPSMNYKAENVRLASVEDFYTEIDKFTYSTDVASLAANIDIEKLMKHRRSLREKNRGDQTNGTMPCNRSVESEKILHALGLTKEEIQTLTVSDDNDTGGSLFDDPDLLKELPPVIGYPSVKRNSPNAAERKVNFNSTENDKSAPNESLCENKEAPDATMQFDNDFKNTNETNMSSEEHQLDALQQQNLEAALAYLNSTNQTDDSDQDKLKAKNNSHRRQVSENDYANMMRYMQTKGHESRQMRMNEVEKARINAAKEMFKHSGAEFLFLREREREQGHKKGFTRPKQHDLKADIEYNKGADFLLRVQNRYTLQKAAKVTNFHGLEPTVPIRPTVKPEEQEKIAGSGKVSHFKGLQSSTKSVRTAEIDESVFASKVVSTRSIFVDKMKKPKQAEHPVTPGKTPSVSFVDVKT